MKRELQKAEDAQRTLQAEQQEGQNLLKKNERHAGDLQEKVGPACLC